MSLSMALPDWQGPVAFEMRLKSDHNQTVRYDCPLDRGKFSLYVPKLLLQSAVGDERRVEILRKECNWRVKVRDYLRGFPYVTG